MLTVGQVSNTTTVDHVCIKKTGLPST